MIRLLLTLLIAATAIACSDHEASSPLGPDAALHDVVPFDADGDHGAWVFIASRACGMFDGNGGGVQGTAQVNVFTDGPDGNALHNCHLDAPNDQGHAVRFTPYDNPFGVPFPCYIHYGEYNPDDPGENAVTTMNWSMTISAGGKGRLTCILNGQG